MVARHRTQNYTLGGVHEDQDKTCEGEYVGEDSRGRSGKGQNSRFQSSLPHIVKEKPPKEALGSSYIERIKSRGPAYFDSALQDLLCDGSEQEPREPSGGVSMKENPNKHNPKAQAQRTRLQYS